MDKAAEGASGYRVDAPMTGAESTNDEAGEMDIAAIEARANKATPGPWDASGWVYGNATTESYGVWAGKPDGSNGVPLAKTSRLERGHADAEFIAHAREDIPALIAEVRRLSDVPGLERQLRDKIAGEVVEWARAGRFTPYGDVEGEVLGLAAEIKRGQVSS